MALSCGSVARLLVGVVLPLIGAVASAQDKYPTQPVKIVVGSEAGSAPDVLSRLLATEMGSALGQTVIVENRPGATGTIAATAVSGAAPDGYTLLMGTVSNIALAPSFFPIRYDPNTSFTPIGMVASVPLVLVTSPAFGVTAFAELAARLKEPGVAEKISYSSPGIGGPQHLAGVLLARQFGVRLLHVPYKSGSAATTAVAAGESQMTFAGIPAAAALSQGKKVLPILVTSANRAAAMPSVPTVTDVGLSNFEIDNWHALFAPAALPRNVRATLESALQKALQQKTVQEQFHKNGAEASFATGAQLATKVSTEVVRWNKVVVENKLKAE